MGMRDPGEAGALIPVLKLLTQEQINLIILADSRAKEAMQATDLGLFEVSPTHPLAVIASPCDLAVVGISDSPGSEVVITDSAHLDGDLVVWVSDFGRGSIFRTYKEKFDFDPRVRPDYLLVVSDWVREQELANLPTGFDPSRVIVVGNPAFDDLADKKLNKDAIRQNNRAELDINEDQKLITYVGTLGETTPLALQAIVDSLQQIGYENYRLAIRRHPRDKDIPQERYDQITAPIKEKLVDTSRWRDTDQAVIASDLVINTTSTVGDKAIYLDVPVVTFWDEEIIDELMKLGYPKQILPEVAENGLSPTIYSVAETTAVLKRVLTDENYIRQLHERMSEWKVDGHAAQRVADFVMNLLKAS